MFNRFLLPIAIWVSSALALTCCAQPLFVNDTLFETDCQSLDQWEFLDLKGGGKILVDEDCTVTNGYGPNIVYLRGEEVLLLAKGVRITEGTILALWKDPNPKQHDADGIIVFEADYPDDLTVPRNTRDRRAHFLVEQDSDKGFQIKYQKAGMDAEPMAEKIHLGLTHDDTWNRSGWMWQKVRIGEGKIRAKYWSAVAPEPEGWPIELDHPNPKQGRVGIKAWSGKVHLAYFSISENEIPVEPPLLDLSISRSILFVDSGSNDENVPEFRSFLNVRDRGTEGLTIRGEFRHEEANQGYVFVLEDLENGEVSLGDTASEFTRALEQLPREPGEVKLTLRLVEAKGNGEKTLSEVTRFFAYRTDDQYKQRFEELRVRAEKSYENEEDKGSDTALEATAALSLLDYAQSNLAEAEFTLVDRTLDYVEECLDPSIHLTDYRFGDVDLPALNLIMGATYSMTVPWESLGIRKSETLTARLEITDDLRIETPIRADSRIAAGDWKNGKASTTFDFQVPHEFPPGSTEPIHRPAIREGRHRLYLSLWDESGNFLWLDNEKPDQPRAYGQRYEIGRLYVTPHPIEITDIRMIPTPLGGALACLTTLVNYGEEEIKSRIRMSLDTPGGFQSSGGLTEATLQPQRETKISFDAGSPSIAGELLAQFAIHLPEGFVSHAETRIDLSEPFRVDVDKANHILRRDNGFVVPISLSVQAGSTAPTTPVKVTAYADGALRETVEWDIGKEPTLELELEPGLGWYILQVQEKGKPAIERRVIAPVWETREGKLYLNGEPFYVKGVNGHGLIGQSPERTRLLMRVLKRMGFNMIRGDYPPPWELDVAQEENMGWMVLAPFSVTSTDVLKERHAPHPMKRMREITRRFIPHYVNKPAMWLWNNFNEVTGETDDLLAMFYPHYKAMDPYRRPVVYANLTGQDRFIGQDVMGINYYYRPYTPLEELKKLIHASQDFGAKANLPVIYCEYNNWYGPVYTEGARAINEMFAAELSPEHPGGFFYQLRENIDRHPGVITDDNTAWTNPTLERAFKEAFADLEIDDYLTDGAIQLTNKRPFTLRKISYLIYEGPVLRDEGMVEDLAPEASTEIVVGDGFEKGGTKLSVKTRFETHYGLWSEVEGEVFP